MIVPVEAVIQRSQTLVLWIWLKGLVGGDMIGLL